MTCSILVTAKNVGRWYRMTAAAATDTAAAAALALLGELDLTRVRGGSNSQTCDDFRQLSRWSSR